MRMRQTIVKEIQDVIDKEARDAVTTRAGQSGTTANAVPTFCLARTRWTYRRSHQVLNKNSQNTEHPSPPRRRTTRSKCAAKGT